jgi:ribosomal protein S18 acetylase RimI-like enzyme
MESVGAYLGDGPWNEDFGNIEGVYLKNGEFVVGIVDGRIVAMGALRPTATGRAELKRIRVEPDFQGRGYGQTMLSYLEGRAVELGFEVLHLDTSETQKAAKRLYLKNGYHETERKQWQGMTVIFYEKNL